jgi:penicillin-binding protein 1A
VRTDSPVNINGWKPENYDRGYRGPITLRRALALSLNTVAVKLNMEVGPQAVVQTAQRLGITSPLQADPSIALGTSEVTLLELVGAYASFANGGFAAVPYVITEVKSADGKLVFSRPAPGDLEQVIDPGTDAMMNEMMHNIFVIGTAQRARMPGWPMAGKTGTTNDYKDAWFVGYTGNLVAGVWLGNDDSTPTKGVSGGNLPTDIWHNFMKIALKDQKPVVLAGVAGAGQSYATGEGGKPRQRARRQKNFFERLFGL